MKNFKIAFCVLLTVSLTFSSCNKDEVINTTDTNSIVASATIDGINELDFQTSMQVSFDNALSKSTQKSSANSLVGTCATISIDNVSTNVFPKVITVDFGTGCTVNNITRKGKLKITLSGLVSTPKSSLKIERENYYVNGLKIEGTIVYTNETTNPNIPQWSRTVTNGKLTNTNGEVYLHSGSHTIQQTEGVGTIIFTDNTYEMISGEHNISKENGTKLTLSVIAPLAKKYDCNYVSKGKLSVKGPLLNGIIDYGNGECDNKLTYTHENGSVFNLTM